MFFCTYNAASKGIILSCIIFAYEKLKKYLTHSFKECLFFVFCLFFFFSLLSNNTLHVISYTHICYWNTFPCKYIIQITFHVVKLFMCEWLQKIFVYFDICLAIVIRSTPFASAWVKSPFEKQRFLKRKENKLFVFAVVLMKGQ